VTGDKTWSRPVGMVNRNIAFFWDHALTLNKEAEFSSQNVIVHLQEYVPQQKKPELNNHTMITSKLTLQYFVKGINYLQSPSLCNCFHPSATSFLIGASGLWSTYSQTLSISVLHTEYFSIVSNEIPEI
jgi:hypothetical protein